MRIESIPSNEFVDIEEEYDASFKLCVVANANFVPAHNSHQLVLWVSVVFYQILQPLIVKPRQLQSSVFSTPVNCRLDHYLRLSF